MFHKIDIRRLAKLSGPDRVFLTVYASGEGARRWLWDRERRARDLLAGSGNELEHFDENMRVLWAHARSKGLPKKGTCLFLCWALDLMEAHPLDAPVRNAFVVDSSPFIRPLAELQDEYENHAVVAADGKRARIYLVASSVVRHESGVRGNIKNHVKVGGWSQQRYERRRDKQLLLYAKDIGDRLLELDRKESFRRVILVGSRQVLSRIRRALPPRIARKAVAEKAVQLGKGSKWVDKEVFDLFVGQERRSERRLWERIRGELLRGGLGAAGARDVRRAAEAGRVNVMAVSRGLSIPGARCRKCETLRSGSPAACPVCGSKSLFDVDFVEELVELVAAHGGATDFVDALPGLEKAGGVAALLRYY